MSYCRFENTSFDLRDCVEALEKREIDVDSYQSEIDGLASILVFAKRIIELEDDILDIIEMSHNNE